MIALVTGHQGFLGSHAADSLRRRGWSVTGAGRPSVELPSQEFDELLAGLRPAVVVHCAGPASVPSAEANPALDRRGSVDVVRALVASLERLNAARILLVSSAAVYGNPTVLPTPTDAGIEPISVYGRHRRDCEELVLASAVPSAIARVFSAYGEGLRRQVWWDIARRAIDEGHVTLQGTGAESRDFVHGEDVGEALAHVVERGTFAGDVYNVASGVETTIASLADGLVDALGAGARVEFTGTGRPGDPRRWQADISSVEALGFRPHVGLEAGIARYARWVRSVL